MLKKMLTGLLIIIVLLAVLLTGLTWRLAVGSRTMEVAGGHDNGQLLPCPDTPNCVSSQAPENDSHYIDAIADPDGSKWSMLGPLVDNMAGASLVSREDGYARYTFRTPLMGFMDDVEFLHAPEQGVIHVRSASRVGRGDLNANRNRVESIRAQLQ